MTTPTQASDSKANKASSPSRKDGKGDAVDSKTEEECGAKEEKEGKDVDEKGLANGGPENDGSAGECYKYTNMEKCNVEYTECLTIFVISNCSESVK